jgi:hypothetical protein
LANEPRLDEVGNMYVAGDEHGDAEVSERFVGDGVVDIRPCSIRWTISRTDAAPAAGRVLVGDGIVIVGTTDGGDGSRGAERGPRTFFDGEITGGRWSSNEFRQRVSVRSLVGEEFKSPTKTTLA